MKQLAVLGTLFDSQEISHWNKVPLAGRSALFDPAGCGRLARAFCSGYHTPRNGTAIHHHSIYFSLLSSIAKERATTSTMSAQFIQRIVNYVANVRILW